MCNMFNSDQQKVADDKNIRRIQREMERVATMMQATMEEHMSVSTINHHIRDQLHSEQEKAFRTEESLKVWMWLCVIGASIPLMIEFHSLQVWMWLCVMIDALIGALIPLMIELHVLQV